MRSPILMSKDLKSFIGWVLLYQAVGFAIGGFTSDDTMSWYAGLEKSTLTPPNIAFPIAWTLLYVLIAAAGSVLWTHRTEKQAKIAFAMFAAYTALNWSWSLVFFELHMIKLAYMWIVVMNGINVAFIIYCWNRYRKAAVLMIPPLAWTCFAAYLNYMIWMLNI